MIEIILGAAFAVAIALVCLLIRQREEALRSDFGQAIDRLETKLNSTAAKVGILPTPPHRRAAPATPDPEVPHTVTTVRRKKDSKA